MYEFVGSCCRIIFNINISTEVNFFCIFRTAKFERISVFEPVIRYFYLISVVDLLFEHTITIADTTSICAVVKSCKRIQEACCQTSQTTVSKGRVRLLILNCVDIKSELIQSFFDFFVCSQVDQVISKCTTHQEFH